MRILTLSYEFPPIGGGGSGVVKGLSRELVRMGHTVDVVTMGFRDLPREEIVDGVAVYRVDCGRRSESKCTAREAFRYIRKARAVVRDLLATRHYDFVHTHFILPDGLVAWREVAPLGIPFIITAHGSDVPGYNPKFFFKIAHPLLKIVWRRIARSAAEIVSPSETLARMIEAMGPGVPVRVIPNGIDTDKYHAAEKKDQILVATRLVERKGVQYLLRALAGANIPWPTIVVGSGEYQAELIRLNEELGRPAKLVGWLNNESKEFRDLLEQSAIYVLPSDFENFPVALLEAMAAGSAIVTTKGHGCEEVVGDSAELVTPGAQAPERCVQELRTALERLTNDRAYCAELGARARRRLDDNFAWTAVARRYLEVYERQLDQRVDLATIRPSPPQVS
jgi:glycosyltransferase involved in cell wall biosynthesis